jgi:RNA polymerase sigma factor (sigma-70 family)
MQTAEIVTLRQYFSDITRLPRLSDEEIRILCQQIATARQQQDKPAETQARQRLVEGLLPEVLPTAYRYASRMQHFTLLDLIQQGNYGLVLAAHRFDFADPSRAFGSYALTYIRSLIKSDLHRDGGIAIPNASFYMQRARGMLDAPLALHHVRLDAVRGQNSEECTLLNMLTAPPPVLSSAHQAASPLKAQVEQLLAVLPTQEQQVLRLCYGLDEQDGRTLDRQDVALLLGLSVQQVASLEREALQLLRYHVGLPGASTSSDRMQQYHQRRRQEQQARLQRAYEHLQAQGQPITRDACVRWLTLIPERQGSFSLHRVPRG